MEPHHRRTKSEDSLDELSLSVDVNQLHKHYAHNSNTLSEELTSIKAVDKKDDEPALAPVKHHETDQRYGSSHFAKYAVTTTPKKHHDSGSFDKDNDNISIVSAGKGALRRFFGFGSNSITTLESEIKQLRLLIKRKEDEMEEQAHEMASIKKSLNEYASAYMNSAEECQGHADKVKRLERAICDLEKQRDLAAANAQQIINKQQLEAFSRLESGSWTPREESQVRDDLHELKRMMRTAAKDFAKERFVDPENIESEAIHDSYSDMLSEIIDVNVFEPLSGMNQTKTASVILNALLAHFVYTRVFKSAFVFLDKAENQGSRKYLQRIYDLARRGNAVKAHAWRAQTLRMMLPPLGRDTTSSERDLHISTQNQINQNAAKLANLFMSTAQVLIPGDKKEAAKLRIQEIFSRAAHLSYEIWTRKIHMRCYTLRNFGKDMVFYSSNPHISLHTLVQYEDSEAEHDGRLITLMVHPLVEVSGTDEGEHYDKTRVWMPAEVWFPKKQDLDKNLEVDLIEMTDM